MKKLLVALLVVCLFGCENSNEIIEDNQINEEIVENNPDENQDSFNSEYEELLKCNGADENKLEEYIKFYGVFDNEKIVYLVNNGYLNEGNIDTIKELYANEYYLSKNEELYLKYLNEYDSVRDCIEAVNTKTYQEYYTNIEDTDTSKNYLMLINKYHCLSSDYEPEDLVDIDPYYGRGQTRSEVYEQYKKMADDAFELGYSFLICSAYRSYDYQDGLYNKYLNSDPLGQESVDTYSARPGHSEHQSGLCLDLSDAVYGMDNFGLSEASTWINENCYKYGFIIRYTEEKQAITGYEAEPWQVRYVGSEEVAKDILDRGITFDEYYACFVEE